MLYRRLIINGTEYLLAVGQFGTGAPAEDTMGAVGVLYMDTDDGSLYKCTGAADGKYAWEPLGTSGGSGEDGATYTPSVTADGVLSWTNNKGLENPKAVNIMGPQGPIGPQGERGADGEQGPQGEIGPQGPGGVNGQDGYTPVRGTDYWTEADKAEIKAYVDDAILGGAW